MQRLIELYTECCGQPPAHVEAIAGAGSNRRYYRLTADAGDIASLIGVIGTSREENEAFVYMSRHFTQRRLPVPRVVRVSGDGMCYLQDDLGRTSLFDALRGGREAGGRYNSHERQLLSTTIRALAEMQLRGARGFDWSRCYPQPAFDTDNVLFDLNYFKYCFLKPSGLDFHELRLEADFRLFAKELTAETTESFMYRDFQARNVMLDAAEQPHFIDFQGGRRGPYYYDVASFLWQASARYSHKLRRDLVADYYDALKTYTEVPSPRHFVGRLSQFVLFRTLQVLGAYGYRGYFERKKHFIDSIPPAMDNLRELLRLNVFTYPYMMDMLRRLTQMYATEPPGHGTMTTDTDTRHNAKREPLVVRIFSFAYKHGLPTDESGNGGGYVFDCRGTHNPGRYEQYKQLTGLDEPVVRFLEDDGEILTFLDNIYPLADRHVERYIQRGFTSLMFAFGCTGGQHRSVYAAQHLAEHIHNKYGVEVRLCHRERGISSTLSATPANTDGLCRQ